MEVARLRHGPSHNERQRHGRPRRSAFRGARSEADEIHEQRALGFWLYLMGDAVIFALMFMTYGIMVGSTSRRARRQGAVQPEKCRARDRAPAGRSTTFGFASLSSRQANRSAVLAWLGLVVTFLLARASCSSRSASFLA